MGKDWYKDWFASEDYLDVYRHRNDEDTDTLIELILKNISIPPNGKILDAACGAGRHSIKFSELGYSVTGFDLSQTLLDLAITEAQSRQLNIHFERADLRNFVSAYKYDLIVSLFTSFGYFNSDEENFIFAKNAYDMLIANGYYVLDYLNEDYLKENLVEFTEKNIGDKEIVENRTIAEGRVIKRIKIKKNNLDNEFLESVKLYSYNELADRFTKIGYKIIHVFGDYNGSAYDSERSERCIIIFQK